MDARTALKNYTNTMIKMYGVSYWESWTEDDRETFNTLAKRARRAFMVRVNAGRENTNFRTILRGGRVTPEAVTAPERKAAWKVAADKAGAECQVTGTLAPEGTSLQRHIDKKNGTAKRTKKTEPTITETVSASGIDSKDVDSTNIMAYLLGK